LHNAVSIGEYTGKVVWADGFGADFQDRADGGQMDKNGLSSFLLGLGVGVGIGMLFAPKSGSETRELLKNKAGEGTDFLKQRSTDMKQTASEWVDKSKEALNRQKGSLADAVEAGRQAYREKVNNAAPSEGTAL
jgi:gas vesicle protein